MNSQITKQEHKHPDKLSVLSDFQYSGLSHLETNLFRGQGAEGLHPEGAGLPKSPRVPPIYLQRQPPQKLMGHQITMTIMKKNHKHLTVNHR